MVSLEGCRFLHSEMLQFIRYCFQQNIDSQFVLNLDKLFFHGFTMDAITQSRVLVYLCSCIRFAIQFNKYLLRTTV